MKPILLVLLSALVACSSNPTSPKPVTGLKADLEKISSAISSEALKKPEFKPSPLTYKSTAFKSMALPTTDTKVQPKLIGYSPVTADQFLGWVKSSVGFKKGEVTEDQLQTLGLDLPYSWRVLKKWDDGSVRIGQIKTPGYFNGLGIIPVLLMPGYKPKPWFGWYPGVWKAIASSAFVEDLKVKFTATQGVAGAQAQPVTCVPASGGYKFLIADVTEIAVRFRSSCFNSTTLAAVPIYLTSYFTFMSDDPVVRIQHVIGNDQLETPVTGGWSVAGVSVQSASLPQMRWVNENSYGNKSFSLADGQQMTFKTVMTFDSAFNSTVQMLVTGSPFGFQYYDDAKASLAFGTAPLPSTRVTLATLNQAHTEVNNAARFPNAQSSDWLGMVDQNPPSTGAQSDFASTMPLEVQKSQQAYSSRQMAAVLLATSRESFRPSHLFKQFEWVSSVDYPNLFWWSGRIHYDWSWNADQDLIWRTRTATGGFIDGNRSGWNTDDNQHISHNTLRYSYELTGDLYSEELLKSYVPVAHWNYFTDWLPHVEAERAFGRSFKHAIALVELFPDLPESALLKSRFDAKMQAYKNAVTQNMARFNGTAVSVPFDGCDGRVNNAVWCGAQQAYGQGAFVAVGWMQGFVNELMTMVPDPDLRLLAAAETYFTPDGILKTYFPAPTPNDFTTGGIGVEWQSGWVQLAQKFPNAPGAQFVLTKVKPILDARMQHGCGFPSYFFCLNDSWFAW